MLKFYDVLQRPVVTLGLTLGLERVRSPATLAHTSLPEVLPEFA